MGGAALVVGDSTTEFDAAHALGFPFLGLLDEQGPRPFLATYPSCQSLAGAAAGIGFA